MRRASLLFFVLFGTIAANAQNSRSYSSGLKAGANLYNLDVENQAGEKDGRTNFHVGLFYNVPFGKILSVQPEILYSGEGSTNTVTTSTNTTKRETRLSVLSVPVMLQANIASGFYAETGPALNVFINSEEQVTSGGTTSELDLGTQLKKTYISWGAGLGYKMKSFGINARYNYGLTNLAKGETSSEIQASGIQISLAWFFKQ